MILDNTKVISNKNKSKIQKMAAKGKGKST